MGRLRRLQKGQGLSSRSVKAASGEQCGFLWRKREKTMLGSGSGRRHIGAAATRYAQFPPLFLCPSTTRLARSVIVEPRGNRKASNAAADRRLPSTQAHTPARRGDFDGGTSRLPSVQNSPKRLSAAEDAFRNGYLRRGRRDLDEAKGEGTSAWAGNVAPRNRANELLMIREVADDIISKREIASDAELRRESEVVLQEAKQLLFELVHTRQEARNPDEETMSLVESTISLALAFNSAAEEHQNVRDIFLTVTKRGVDIPLPYWSALFQAPNLPAERAVDLFNLARQICGDDAILNHEDIIGSYCNVLCQHNAEAELASVQQLYEECQKVISRCVFDNILRLHLRHGNNAQARRTLRLMEEHRFTTDTDTLLLVVMSGRGLQKRRDILDMLDETDLHGQGSRESVLNEVVNRLCERSDPKGVLAALRVFGASTIRSRFPPTQKGFRPLQTTYFSIVRMFTRLNMPQHALRFAGLAMDESCCRADHTSKTSSVAAALDILRAFGRLGLHQKAVEAGAHLIDVQQSLPNLDLTPSLDACYLPPRGSVSPSRRIYASMIHSAARLPLSQVVPAARALLIDLSSHRKAMDGAVRAAVADVMLAIMRHVRKSEVVKILDEVSRVTPDLSQAAMLDKGDRTVVIMRDKAQFEEKVDNHNLSHFLGMLQQRGTLDRLLIAADRDERRLRQGRHSQVIVRRPDHLDAQEWMRDADMAPTFDSQAMSPDEDSTTLSAAEREMDLGEKLSSGAYALRLMVYGVLRLDHASARAIYRSMVSHGVTPGMLHIAPIVEGLVAMGRISEAIDVQRGAKERMSEDTTRRIYAAIARGFARRRNWTGVKKIFDEMRADGVDPDQTLLGMLAAAERQVSSLSSTSSSSSSSSSRQAAGRQYSERLVRTVQGDLIREQRSTTSLDDTTVMTATSTFATLMNRGLCLEAQQYMYRYLASPSASWAKSLPSSQERADSILRRQLARAQHWIQRELSRQQVTSMDDANASQQIEAYDSKTVYFNEALELVKRNRHLARAAAPRRTKARHEERQARSRFLKLFYDAIVTRRLFNEAQKAGRKPPRKDADLGREG